MTSTVTSTVKSTVTSTATPVDRALLDDVRARVGRASAAGEAPDDGTVRAALQATGRVLGSRALAELTRAARAELTGAGPLQPFLDQPDVTDVLVNGPREVWVDRGAGLERAPLDLGSPAEVRALAVRMAAVAGQRLDDASPIVDARLPDGTRLHAALEPIAASGAVLALRVLRQAGFTVEGLVESGSVPARWAGLLRALVGVRANVLLSGGTGTGKTTLLAALLALVPADERIITVEEARELQPAHPHVVPLTARRPNVEGVGEVTLAELVRGALRMRPDRIVLGEARGPEVRELLLAMNTGHDGGLATVHANAAEHVPARLEALGALAGMPRDAVAAQGAAALDVVLHLRRCRGRRVLAQVGVVHRDDRGGLAVTPAAEWDGSAGPEELAAWATLERRWGPW